MTQENALKLPPFFPTTVPQCKEQTEIFFNCFTEKGKKTIRGDKESGIKGLTACKSELGQYVKCMLPFEKDF